MKISILVFILCFVSISNYSQPLDLSKTKEVKILRENYSITIPKKMNVKETNGIDFYGYYIKPKRKELIQKYQFWIYYGRFPNNMGNNSLYKLIDSTNIQVLNQKINFKIYKTDLNFYTEGFIIVEPPVSTYESPLQFRISAQSDNQDNFKKVIEIIKSLYLSEQLILID
jgi:hypothetical protein